MLYIDNKTAVFLEMEIDTVSFLYSFWWLCAPPPRQLEVSGGMG